MSTILIAISLEEIYWPRKIDLSRTSKPVSLWLCYRQFVWEMAWFLWGVLDYVNTASDISKFIKIS